MPTNVKPLVHLSLCGDIDGFCFRYSTGKKAET
jgi:hypothetical protein